MAGPVQRWQPAVAQAMQQHGTFAKMHGQNALAAAPEVTRDAGMKVITIRHATTYRYSAPVTFGQHRLMLRPRDSHDLRLVEAELALAPGGRVRWVHDVFGNSVALVDFDAPAAELSVVSTLTIERYALARPDFPI